MNNYQQAEARIKDATWCDHTEVKIIQKTNYAFVTPALSEVCELARSLAAQLDAIHNHVKAQQTKSSRLDGTLSPFRAGYNDAMREIELLLEPDE